MTFLLRVASRSMLIPPQINEYRKSVPDLNSKAIAQLSMRVLTRKEL